VNGSVVIRTKEDDVLADVSATSREPFDMMPLYDASE